MTINTFDFCGRDARPSGPISHRRTRHLRAVRGLCLSLCLLTLGASEAAQSASAPRATHGPGCSIAIGPTKGATHVDDRRRTSLRHHPG